MPLPKLIENYKITSEICSYGCNLHANFAFVNGKFCCERSQQSCSAQKEANSKGVKNANLSGKRKKPKNIYKDLPEETKQRMAWSKGKNVLNDSRIKGSTILNRDLILKNDLLPYECYICHIGEWESKPISLELDHINGDRTNNDLSNLRFLCPNCHSQTATFRGRNINQGTKKVSDEELSAALSSSNSIREALIKVQLAPKGGNYARAYNLLHKMVPAAGFEPALEEF